MRPAPPAAELARARRLSFFLPDAFGRRRFLRSGAVWVIAAGLLPALCLADPDIEQLEAAAMRGDSDAQFQLGLAYREKAYVWLEVAQAFKRDKSKVPHFMANTLCQDWDEKDHEEAEREIDRLTAEIKKNRPTTSQVQALAMGGDADAQAELAWRYCLGDGAEEDMVKSLAWAAVADSSGYAAVPGETTVETITELGNPSEADIEKAKREARELTGKIKKSDVTP